ncbi:CaiB/BaiF CoA transferase family protein [Rhodococcus jostii]|uniref:CaiB/BaiF CoA transferase family protein n=1 Tax=Rhodococcus jostii TaxID=132919 RepID=UPI00365C55DE
MGLPLEGLRILSLAHQYPGPYATLLLSDLGAEIVLVERPGAGDPARAFPGFHGALARGKRSVVLDLKVEQGRNLLLALVKKADVVLDGYRPGALDKLGVGPDALTRICPKLVYVSVSGYGLTGPYADRSGHDLTYQAEAGVLYEHVPPAAPPAAPSLALGDLVAGLLAAQAVLIGLFRRERDHDGSKWDVSMFDGLVSLLTAHVGPVLNQEGPPGFPYEPGYGVFRTRDDVHLALGVAHEDHFWRALCDIAGMEEDRGLVSSERFAEHTRLRSALERAIAKRPADEWEDLLKDHDVPFGRVRSLADLAESPHVIARELLMREPGGGVERVYVRQPLGVNGELPGPRTGVPSLGQHTVEVLTEAGIPADIIEAALDLQAAVQGSCSSHGGTDVSEVDDGLDRRNGGTATHRYPSRVLRPSRNLKR